MEVGNNAMEMHVITQFTHLHVYSTNWLLNGHDEHCTEENDAILS
jgi:hypothetical protein